MGILHFAYPASSEAAEGDDGEAEAGRQTIGLFLGNTTQDRRTQERRAGGTLGLEYEYRVGRRLGLGAVAEYARGDFDTAVVVLPLAFHAREWKFFAGPGFELSEEGSEPLLRIGAEYAFEFGELEVAPQVGVDLVSGERLFIFGVVFAHPF